MSFRVSQLEKTFKGMVRTLDLYNMEKKLEESMEMNMGNMEKKNGEVGGKYGKNC